MMGGGYSVAGELLAQGSQSLVRGQRTGGLDGAEEYEVLPAGAAGTPDSCSSSRALAT